MAAYLTISEAQDYFDERLHTTAWDVATDDERTKALATATRAIDRLNFAGDKTDSEQANEFPRDSEDTPQAILDACAEISIALLDGRDPEMEYESLTVSSGGFSSVREARREGDVQAHLAAGIPSALAWQMLLPYLRDSRSISLMRA